MNRTFHYVGTALLFLVASACQETSQDAEQISTTKTPVVSPTAATDTSNLLQANSTATALSLGKLAIPTQASSSSVPLTNIAAQESRNAVADAADSDTILSQTTQDLWKIAPEMETFVLKAEEENTLELEQGSVIEFPKDAFVYTGTNEPVKGNVAIMAKEYRNMSDCITAGLTTMSDKGILESGGMMYVDAVAEGRKCELRKDKPMKVALPTWGKKDERMKLFTGKRKKNGQVTWKEMPKTEGEQLPESEAPKRKKKQRALENNFNYLVGPKFAGYESMPDTSFEGFVSKKMLAVNRVRYCKGKQEMNMYNLNNQGKNTGTFHYAMQDHYTGAAKNGSYFFPVRNTEISFSQAPIVKISQENILTNVDKTTVPKDYVALTGKTLKVLKLELEDKWQEKKDGNNQTYYVNKTTPLKSQLKMQEEKTFCRIYVKTNKKGAAAEILFRDYNFILTRYMHKWLEYALRQRVWKPNLEGNVFIEVYVGKKDFRKMKRWYANKATNLEECKAQYDTQYQKYLQECREIYAKNPEIRAAHEKEMAEYEVRKAEYEKREKMTAAEREKAFAQDFKENPNDFDEMTVQNYVFRTNRMGWINCDRFPGIPLMTLKFNLKKGEFVNAVVAFNSIRSMLGGNISNRKICTFQTPKNEKLLVWLVKEQDGKRYFALKRLTSGSDNDITEADFQELTFEKLQEISKSFSKISET